MMIISHKYKFIFIKTKKTAGTSIEVYLSDLCGDEDIITSIYPAVNSHKPRNYEGLWNPIPEIIRHPELARDTLRRCIKKEKYYNHMSALEVKDRLAANFWNTYYKFSVDRNPWDKALSQYYMLKDRRAPYVSFQEYLERDINCFNSPLYTDITAKVMVDRVLRFENLNEDLGEVFGKLRVPYSGSLGINAKGGHRKDKSHYSEIYTSTQRDIIANKFSTEINLNGYTF
jgi:hypothetical protein